MEQERNKNYTLEMMDAYLASLGLWRKQVANDGSCLFRAAAEQINISFSPLNALAIFYMNLDPQY